MKLEVITDADREEIGRLIAEGNMSGLLQGEDKKGSYRISWKIDIEKWR